MNRMEWKFEQTRQYIWNRPTTKPKVIVWLNTRSFRQIVLAHKMVGTFTVLIRDTMTTIEVQRVIWGSCRCLCQSFLSLTHSVCVCVCVFVYANQMQMLFSVFLEIFTIMTRTCLETSLAMNWTTNYQWIGDSPLIGLAREMRLDEGERERERVTTENLGPWMCDAKLSC